MRTNIRNSSEEYFCLLHLLIMWNRALWRTFFNPPVIACTCHVIAPRGVIHEPDVTNWRNYAYCRFHLILVSSRPFIQKPTISGISAKVKQYRETVSVIFISVIGGGVLGIAPPPPFAVRLSLISKKLLLWLSTMLLTVWCVVMWLCDCYRCGVCSYMNLSVFYTRSYAFPLTPFR